MNFKKLSVAAALSIGMMTLGSVAQADQAGPIPTGAACPVSPPARMAEPCPAPYPAPTDAACPVPVIIPPAVTSSQEVYSPLCASPASPQCPDGAVLSDQPIAAALPNYAPNAKVIKRQAYAFPSIGSSVIVYPSGDKMVQIGGEEENIAVNAYGNGLIGVPQNGALTLMPKQQIGVANSIAPVCPTQVRQGTEISRCNVPSATKVFQSAFMGSSQIGAAAPAFNYPMGAAAPLNQDITGAACPVCPSNAPLGLAAPAFNYPIGAAAPLNQDVTGAAAKLAGDPRSIQTSSGIQIQRSALVPVQITGAACPVQSQFPDVSSAQKVGCDINKLAEKGILAGYPDRTYKPCLPIMRDEMASAVVSALDLRGCVPDFKQQIFRDVPLAHWANKDIDIAYNKGLMEGYPNNDFRPDQSISRAEALSIMAKAIPGEIASCDAQNILCAYPDANQVPNWAVLPVAEALNSGLLNGLPDCDQIRPNDNASRAEVATMLKNLRIKLALDTAALPTGAAAALQPQVVTSTIPTLKMKFDDIISARTSEVGDRILAKTTESVNIDSQFYPAGTIVRGRVAEVIRPGLGKSGAIRIAFSTIGDKTCQTQLPHDILSAVVVKENNPNIVGRFFAWPFSWSGKVAGVAGRTVGGTVNVASNMTETFLTNIGNGNNELFNGKLAASGRSYLMSGQDLFSGVFDTAKTAFSGTVGVFKVSGDEIAYVAKPDGSRIAQINPNEVLSVAFAGQ